jgi:hypothetical protein
MKTRQVLILAVIFFSLGTAIPQVQPSISFTPPFPRPGETVTFTLTPSTNNIIGDAIVWDFGDSTPPLPTNTFRRIVPHAFAQPGTYIVQARYTIGSGAIENPRVTVVVLPNLALTWNPASPKAGQAVTFQAIGFAPGTLLNWNFGDGTVLSMAAMVQTHVYKKAGAYVVRATDARNPAESVGNVITVTEAEGPLAPFDISGFILRWNDGRTAIQVGKDFSPLIAYADLKFQGTGVLYYQWLVDGNVFKTGQVALTFAGQATIDSGGTPGLPTQTPGVHQVSLRFVRPAAAFDRMPVITYEVAAVSRRLPPPRIDQAVPAKLEPGKEYELALVGSDLTPDTDISLGRAIAVLEKAKILSDVRARVRVFVPKTVELGEYPVLASNANGKSSGPGAVIIGLAIPPVVSAKPLPAKVFCPDFAAVKHGNTTMLHGYSMHSEMKSTKVYILDDHPTFKWTPANLGQTEFWDFLILDKSRKNVLFRRRLDAFVHQTKLTSAEVVKLVADAKGGRWAPQTEPSRLNVLASEAGLPVQTEVPDWTIDNLASIIADKGDVYIGVAGYRRYTCFGGSLAGAKPSGGPQIITPDEYAFRTYEIVTEHSTLFPYKLPVLPDGIGCPAGGKTRDGSSVQCIPTYKEKIKKPDGTYAEDPNNYVDTPFRVSGYFSVADSPYNVEGGDFAYPPKPQSTGGSSSLGPVPPGGPINVPPIEQPESGPPVTAGFSNIFIDWGDGTVERLSAEPADAKQYWQCDTLGVLGSVNRGVRWSINYPKEHYYKKTGSYTKPFAGCPAACRGGGMHAAPRGLIRGTGKSPLSA